MSRKTCAQRGCVKAPFEGSKCIDHADILSAPSLARQLAQARKDNSELRKKLAISGAESRLSERNHDLLVRLVANLLDGQDASGVLVSVGASESSSGDLRRTDQPSPGASTRLARRAVRELRTAIAEACDTFENAMEHDWKPPRVDDGVPRLRCNRRDCAARDVTVKAWRTIRGGRRIYVEHCATCGGPMALPEEET